MDITYLEAIFGALRSAVTKPLYKIDSGVILRIVGVDDLPEYFNADFSTSPTGTATRMLGHDGDVTIPDALLQTGLPIYCWVYVVNETTGRTVYSVKIPVKQRANVEDAQPTPEQADIITQAITALNNAGDSASQSASEAQTYAERAETASESAQASETNAGQSAVESQGYAESASQSAQDATESESKAKGYAESARASAVWTDDMKREVDETAEVVQSAKTEAQGFAQSAQASAESAQEFSQSADGFAQDAQASAESASASARAASEAKDTAIAKADEASGYAQTATDQAGEAQQARQGAEEAQALAETAQGKAEEAQTAAETAQVKAEEAAKRATNGTYDNMTAGSAKQLISSKYTVEAEPYTFGASGGNGADREYDKIVGGSIVWNQLYQIRNASYTDKGLTAVASEDRSIFTINGTTTTTGGAFGMGIKNVKDHIYYYHGHLSDATSMYFSAQAFGSDVNNNGKIVKSTSTNATWWYVFTIKDSVTVGTVIENVTARPQIFDLTQMFGSEIADYIYNLEQTTPGAGVAWFRKYFPKDYYKYNPGELMHVSDLQSHDMVGFNIVSESAHVGGYWTEYGNYRDNTAGNYVSFGDNKWPVVPGMDYCFSVPNIAYQTGIYVATFDKAGNYLTRRSTNRVSATTSKIVYTMPDYVYYIGVYFNRSGNNFTEAELKDICINLSWDGERDGEYEPYVKHSYPLDSSLTLRGIPKLSTDGRLYYDGDHYKSDGTVERRYGIVDLSALEWTTKATGSTHKSVYTTLPASYTGHPRGSVDFLSDTYMPSGTGYYSGSNDSKITSPDDSKVGFLYYSNSNSAKPRSLYLIVGVNDTPTGYLIYTVAEPTTEEAQPYHSLQIADPYGTEEYVTTGIVPVGHETKYPENLRAKIEGLPWDFSSLIAPTENGTASRNYTVGSLLIMDNVLYKVTANIANGGAITPNTNVVATTLSEVISALA